MSFTWISSLTVLLHLLLLWSLSSLLQTQPDCLNSQIVSRLEKVNFAMNKEVSLWQVDSCQKSRFLSKVNQNLNDSPWPLVRRVNRLQALEGILSHPKHQLMVRIIEDEPNYFNVSANLVELGAQVASAPEQLEKAILMAWLKQIDPHADKDQLLWEIKTETILSLARISEINEPIGQQTDTKIKSWIQGMLSFREYCFSSTRSIVHLSFCSSLLGKTKSSSLDLPTIWGFRQTFSNALVERVNSLKQKDKINWIRKFIENKNESSVLENLKLPRDYAQLSSFRLWWQDTLDFLWKLGEAEPLIRKREADADVLIHFADMEALPSNLSTNKKLGRLGLLSQKGRLKLIPGIKDTGLQDAGVIVREWIEVSCRRPKLKKLPQVNAERLLIIHDCSPQLRDWSKLISWGVEEFLKDQKGMEYIRLHLPSLKLGLKNLEDKKSDVYIDDMSALHSIFGWQDVVLNKDKIEYRPRAAIAAVLSYRLVAGGDSRQSAEAN